MYAGAPMNATEPLTGLDTTGAPPASLPGLKRRRLVVMILFFLLSGGLYYPIWFMRRRAALNRLDSPRKLQLWPFLIATIWLAFHLSLTVAVSPDPPEEALGPDGALFFAFAQLAVGILMIVQSFFTKDILEDHLAGPGDSVPNPMFVDVVTLSGVMTFLFQIFYLQHVISRYLAGSKSFSQHPRDANQTVGV